MKKICLVTVLALITAGFANGEVLIDENFDSLPIGGAPANWTTETDTPPTNSGVSDDYAASASHSLKFIDEASLSYKSRQRWYFRDDHSAASGDDIEFSFKWYYHKCVGTDLQQAISFQIGNNYNNLFTIYVREAGSTDNDWIDSQWYSHLGRIGPDGPAEDTWIEVAGTMFWDHEGTGAYDYMDFVFKDMAGNPVITANGEDEVLPYAGPISRMGAADMFFMGHGHSTPGSYVYIDDVYFELLPEPATMLLLGLGGLLLRRRVA